MKNKSIFIWENKVRHLPQGNALKPTMPDDQNQICTNNNKKIPHIHIQQNSQKIKKIVEYTQCGMFVFC